ncbi:MAG: hypothetical protein MUP09_10690 [Thiovulaceae bacterium]|nr:hypothetical protein [Sulfurimonadaceae bacterium]
MEEWIARRMNNILSCKLPYGVHVARSTTKAAQKKLRYKALQSDDIPVLIDEAFKKALQPDPYKRYGELSECAIGTRRLSARLASRCWNATRSFFGKASPLSWR